MAELLPAKRQHTFQAGNTIAAMVTHIACQSADLECLAGKCKQSKVAVEYENRQLPATGGIDAYQARFPGLYAIYTETPERRRINAMYAIVLICLFLSIVHLMTTVAMLYGAIKRMPNWIIPWFFTCAPLVIMCTAYSVLWWSGDVFNEQLTMSVAEFVGSLAVNGVCFIVVIMYYLRLTGRLSSDKPGSARSTTYIPGEEQANAHWRYEFRESKIPIHARSVTPGSLCPEHGILCAAPSRQAYSLPSPPPGDQSSYPRSSSTPVTQPPPLYPKPSQRIPPSAATNQVTICSKTAPSRRGVIAPMQNLDSSPRKKHQSSFTRSQ
uniref:Uncharacterized protein n=1 Tax=Ditylenchus dipsaci TaxID=166011 RepID=A0A915DM65_9BILA